MLDQRRVTGRRIVAFVIDAAIGNVLFWAMFITLGNELGSRAGINITMRVEMMNGEAYGDLMGTIYRLDGGTFAGVACLAMAYWIGVFVVV